MASLKHFDTLIEALAPILDTALPITIYLSDDGSKRAVIRVPSYDAMAYLNIDSVGKPYVEFQQIMTVEEFYPLVADNSPAYSDTKANLAYAIDAIATLHYELKHATIFINKGVVLNSYGLDFFVDGPIVAEGILRHQLTSDEQDILHKINTTLGAKP